MNKVLGVAALAATLMAGAAIPAYADTITGVGTSASPEKLSAYGDAGTIAFPKQDTVKFSKGDFTYNFFFQVDSAANLDGITASASSTYKGIPNVTFSSFQIVDLFKVTPVDGKYYPAVSGQSYTIAANETYHLIVKGNVSNGTGAFNGNLSVSAVPLPNSVALFGTAVLGLGVFGAMRRKKAAVSAA